MPLTSPRPWPWPSAMTLVRSAVSNLLRGASHRLPPLPRPTELCSRSLVHCGLPAGLPPVAQPKLRALINTLDPPKRTLPTSEGQIVPPCPQHASPHYSSRRAMGPPTRQGRHTGSPFTARLREALASLGNSEGVGAWYAGGWGAQREAVSVAARWFAIVTHRLTGATLSEMIPGVTLLTLPEFPVCMFGLTTHGCELSFPE